RRLTPRLAARSSRSASTTGRRCSGPSPPAASWPTFARRTSSVWRRSRSTTPITRRGGSPPSFGSYQAWGTPHEGDHDVIEARFGHVNLVARDWRHLADFYIKVLGCEFVPPERDLRGPVLEAGTGIPGAALHGAHLRLPGGGAQGPTLEIFQYESGPEALPVAANRPGFGHVAFVVPE